MLKNTVQHGGPGSLTQNQPLLHVSHNKAIVRLSRIVVASMGLAMAAVMAFQLLYPPNRALPRTSFGGYSLGNASQQDIENALADIDKKIFTARTDKNTYTQSLHDIGLTIQSEKIARELSDYPIKDRIIPFSFLQAGPKPVSSHLLVYDAAKLQAFASKVAAENNTEPVEGSIANKEGDFVITSSTAGRSYRAEDISRYFEAYTHQTLSKEAYLPYSSIAPVNSYGDLEALAEKAEAIVETKHVLIYQAVSFEVDENALRRSISFVAGADKKLVLAFNPKELQAGLETAADGVFLSPTSQSPGHELDWAVTAERLVAALKANSTEAEVALKQVVWTGLPLYPATSKGIQQLIENWNASHASIGAAITFSEIGGLGRKASIDGDSAYFSASVYKVFPAWYALDQIDQGKLDPSGTIAAGFNLTDCFHNMIIVSDSKCSEAIVYKYGGWPAMDALARDHGIEGITLSSGVTITANGMSTFLRKLDAGELLSPERTSYLLDAMKRQKYRTGFPAGSDGEVADKVGYQPKTYSWHDAAIVYHPKTKYTLVVLTKKGASLPILATLAQQISDTFNR